MINAYESYPEAGIAVARGATSPAFAQRLTEDCEFYMGLPMMGPGTLGYEKAPHSPHPVYWRRFTSEELMEIGRPATAKLLGKLGMETEYMVAINRQPAGSYQWFHQDDEVEPPVVVVHPTPGAFDFFPFARTKAETQISQYRTIEVEAGDIVAQYRPEKFHRGRNPLSRSRFNLVLFH